MGTEASRQRDLDRSSRESGGRSRHSQLAPGLVGVETLRRCALLVNLKPASWARKVSMCCPAGLHLCPAWGVAYDSDLSSICRLDFGARAVLMSQVPGRVQNLNSSQSFVGLALGFLVCQITGDESE